MGVISELFETITKGMENPEKVIEGIRNNIKLENGNLPEEEQNEILRRRLICEQCNFMSENAKALGNYASKRKYKHCSLCKCPIKSKTASLSSNCGIEVLNKKLKENLIPLKWEAYKPKK